MRDDARPLAVFDLDGTLADTTHRQHFLEGARRDWQGFFSAAADDPPLAEGVRLVLASERECEVVYLTDGRSAAAGTRWPGWHGRGCRTGAC